MDQQKIWHYFQNDEEIGDLAFQAQARYTFLAAKIAPEAAVLNIGVGRGGLEKILTEKGCHVSCLDPSEDSIQRLRSRLALADRAQVGYAQSIPFSDASFDVVVVSEVLEHLSDEDLHDALTEARRVLRPGGRCIGTVPADENILSSRVVCPGCGMVFHRWGHLQVFSQQRLRAIVKNVFSDVDVTRHYFGDYRSLNWKGRLVWAFKTLAVALGVKGANESFFFDSKKA
jgi:ubiquinone/menaquinone biosynthesis C-methylase UbiE